MANILNSINQRIGAELNAGNKRVGGTSDASLVLDRYRKAMENGEVVKVVFSTVGKDATFTGIEDDVVIVLPGAKYLEYGKSASTFATANLLGNEFQVKVFEIDEEDKKVYVELAGGMKRAYATTIREEVNNAIAHSVSQGESPIVWGRVVKVSRDTIMVDILDKGVLGFLHKSFWSKEFVRNMEAVCKKDEYFQFEVLRKANKVEGKPTAWLLGRRNIAVSAWDSLDVAGLEEGGVLLVRCVERPMMKSFWWGSTPRLPGIEIMGDYTERFSLRQGMYVGIEYKCMIKRVDKVAHKLCVVPFDVVPADRPKVARLNGENAGKDDLDA